jgi:hypothetical protein
VTVHPVVVASAVGLALASRRRGQSLAQTDERPLVPARPSRKFRAAAFGAASGISAWAAEFVVPHPLLASLGGGGLGGLAYNRTAPVRLRFRRSAPREILLGAASGFSSDKFADLMEGTLSAILWRAIGGAVVGMVVADFLPPELQLQED